jgi:RNA polymerase-interacting CarD/CdnL/TRCF family regulator
MQPTPQEELSSLLEILKELKIEDTDENELRDTMLTAHTALSELNAGNEAKFAEVIEDLKKRKK